MWYASPFVPCWTAIARLPAFFFLKASASFSSIANVVGTLTSAVFTTSPMFSICVGTPYSFLTAVPYENALRRVRGELGLRRRAEDDRLHEAVGRELAGPVVRRR